VLFMFSNVSFDSVHASERPHQEKINQSMIEINLALYTPINSIYIDMQQ